MPDSTANGQPSSTAACLRSASSSVVVGMRGSTDFEKPAPNRNAYPLRSQDRAACLVIHEPPGNDKLRIDRTEPGSGSYGARFGPFGRGGARPLKWASCATLRRAPSCTHSRSYALAGSSKSDRRVSGTLTSDVSWARRVFCDMCHSAASGSSVNSVSRASGPSPTASDAATSPAVR